MGENFYILASDLGNKSYFCELVLRYTETLLSTKGSDRAPAAKVDNDRTPAEVTRISLTLTTGETASNGLMTGGATYIVISRPDGSTVSEIIQNADETLTSGKENISFDRTRFGKIQITLRYSSHQQRLMIVIHQCCNLIPARVDKDTLLIHLWCSHCITEEIRWTGRRLSTKSLHSTQCLMKRLSLNFQNPTWRMQCEARTDWYLIKNIKESNESLNETSTSVMSQQSNS
ncbi:hypothetical protein EB796_016605 [Bugula neritina]|uniref:Uncharacterized protein n=1 Tax=Bugula neritina TaxID=10212 RepID=A0A7J7JHJ3_BUGNE|nr:hypothetical protein EB796_016605 [Bugula neritina]